MQRIGINICAPLCSEFFIVYVCSCLTRYSCFVCKCLLYLYNTFEWVRSMQNSNVYQYWILCHRIFKIKLIKNTYFIFQKIKNKNYIIKIYEISNNFFSNHEMCWNRQIISITLNVFIWNIIWDLFLHEVRYDVIARRKLPSNHGPGCIYRLLQ